MELGLLLIGKAVEVHIIGTPAVLMGVDFVLDAVQARHEQRRIAIVGGVEAHAVRHHVLAEVFRRDGHMAELPVNIHHLEVHHLDVLVPQ